MFPLAQYGKAIRDERLERAAHQRLLSSLRRRRTDRQRRTFLRRLVSGVGVAATSQPRTGNAAR